MCGGHGPCINGYCQCESSIYYGDKCEYLRCRAPECLASGDSCYVPGTSSSLYACNGKGVCFDGGCTCTATVNGSALSADTDCTYTACPGNGLCSGVGQCVSGACACDAQHQGEDCELDICPNTDGFVPGLAAEYFNGYNFDVRVLSTAQPNIAFDYPGSPLPGVNYDWFSIVWTGFIRTNITGTYKFDCPVNRGECAIFVNGTLIATNTQLVQLVANRNVRVKVTFQQADYGGSVYWNWMPPGQTTWSNVPAVRLLHEVVCDGGCGGHGCCVADGTCDCEPGE